MTIDELLEMLSAECEAVGGQRAWAEQHGVSKSHVSDVLSRKRDPADLICKALGVRRVLYFEKLKNAGKGDN